MGKTKRGLWIGIAFLMMGAGAVGVVLTIYPEQHILTNTIHQHYKIKVLYKYTVVI